MTSSAPQADACLREAAANVCYEFAALREIVRLLPGEPWTPTGLIWEAGLIHCRVLADFFFPRPSYKPERDIVARDFAPMWRPENDVVLGPYDLRTLRRRLDRSLAHLSWDRLIATDDLVYAPVAKALEGYFEGFVAMLTPGRRRWFALLDEPRDVQTCWQARWLKAGCQHSPAHG